MTIDGDQFIEAIREALRKGYMLDIHVAAPCLDADDCEGPESPRDSEAPMFAASVTIHGVRDVDGNPVDAVWEIGSGFSSDDPVAAIREAIADAESDPVAVFPDAASMWEAVGLGEPTGFLAGENLSAGDDVKTQAGFAFRADSLEGSGKYVRKNVIQGDYVWVFTKPRGGQ